MVPEILVSIGPHFWQSESPLVCPTGTVSVVYDSRLTVVSTATVDYCYVWVELPEEMRNKPLRLAAGYSFQIGPWSLSQGARFQPPDVDDGTNRWLRVEMNGNNYLDVEIAVCHKADINGDAKVDGADLALVLGAWGKSGIEDINRDGTVDGADLSEILSWWI